MTCIFHKGGLYIGKDEHDVTNATKMNPIIDICIHIWNYRVEYSYMQPSQIDEKHYASGRSTAVNDTTETIRPTNGQNTPGNDGYTRVGQRK